LDNAVKIDPVTHKRIVRHVRGRGKKNRNI
jgi:hypothetical protein